MHATIRRYEGVDQNRMAELSDKASEKLVPKLSELPGFRAYYLIEAENGVMSSIGLFDNVEQADESTRIASTWIREEKLDTALPNPPKVTSGKVISSEKTALVVA
jgi:hypothetical protein